MQGKTTPKDLAGPGVSGGSDGPRSMPAQHATPLLHAKQPFGASLEPVLQKACDDKLSQVSWFRTDWQRGGALTGYASYRTDEGADTSVVVKLPVPPVERLWLARLQTAQDVVPRLYAHGEVLNGYDMAWIVMERMAYGPLDSAWAGGQFDLLVEAAGRFYKAAGEFPTAVPAPERDWQEIFQHARQNVHRHGLPQQQRWNKVFKHANRKLKQWLTIWNGRAVDHWCHGDLHPGNAMTRVAPPGGPALLIDFALTHPGHWVEDAVYLEHLYWSRRDRLDGRRLCRQIAHERKGRGLPVDPDWPRLAQTRRVLLALSTPAQLHLDGNAHHVQAALELLESEVG